MEASEITRRNEAIAKYLGWEKISRVPQHYVWESKDGCSYPYLEFDEKWDVLMPAVEKIIKEANIAFHIFPPFGGETFTCRFGMGKNWSGDTMIEAVWMAVSDYVLSLGK